MRRSLTFACRDLRTNRVEHSTGEKAFRPSPSGVAILATNHDEIGVRRVACAWLALACYAEEQVLAGVTAGGGASAAINLTALRL